MGSGYVLDSAYNEISGYKTFASTIGDGVTTEIDQTDCHPIDAAPNNSPRPMGQIYALVVTNDTATSKDLQVLLGTTSAPAIVVKAGETKVLYMPIGMAWLKNSSGSTVTYRAEIYGKLKKDTE